jgi:hypothetical protein
MIYDIKEVGISSSGDKGSYNGFILIVPLSTFYIGEDVFDGVGTIDVCLVMICFHEDDVGWSILT